MIITGFANCALRDRIAAAGVPLIEKPFLANVWMERIRDTFHNS
jgi:hypothetical protein